MTTDAEVTAMVQAAVELHAVDAAMVRKVTAMAVSRAPRWSNRWQFCLLYWKQYLTEEGIY